MRNQEEEKPEEGGGGEGVRRVGKSDGGRGGAYTFFVSVSVFNINIPANDEEMRIRLLKL